MSAVIGKDELIQVVERSLATLERSYRGHADESDLYEAALLSVAVNAARAAGGVPTLTYDGRASTTQLRFRRSPGCLWRGQFTYVVVSFAGSRERIEIHLGVKVVGVSGVAHECDVAVLDSTEADECRRDCRHPRRNNLVAAIEAKNYSASPKLGVGRGFLGLSMELSKDRCSLAFPARGSASIMKLIAKKNNGTCFDQLTPYSPASDRLQSHLEIAIRRWIAAQT